MVEGSHATGSLTAKCTKTWRLCPGVNLSPTVPTHLRRYLSFCGLGELGEKATVRLLHCGMAEHFYKKTILMLWISIIENFW